MRHELHLTRIGLRALLVVIGPMLAVGWLVDGRPGAASVAWGTSLMAANQLTAALSIGWSRELRPRVVAVGYAVFVVRMLAVFAALAAAAATPWVDRPLFAGSFCAALVLTLTVECLSYVRRSYVPPWRWGA